MKELKRTKTVEEIIGYEAVDGKIFTSKEECSKYEQTAKAVCSKAFKELFVGEEFSECYIWEKFGDGNDEYMMAIVDIKNAEDLEIANRFYEINGCKTIPKEYIGERILVTLGFIFDGSCGEDPCPRTMEDLKKAFNKTLDEFFNPEPKE